MLPNFLRMFPIKQSPRRVAVPICENKPVLLSRFAPGLLFAAFLPTKLCSLLPDYKFHAPWPILARASLLHLPNQSSALQ